jgi:predicted outer membrane repeat protein
VRGPSCVIRLKDSYFFNNSALINGGGFGVNLSIDMTLVNVAFTNVTMDSNRAVMDGGAFALSETSVAVFNKCLFTGNEAQYGGVASIATMSNLTFDQGTLVQNNRAGISGGALRLLSNATVMLMGRSILRNNSAGEEGGGIFSDGETKILISDGVILAGNRAKKGGAISLRESSYLRAADAVFDQNIAEESGGALLSDGRNSTFVGLVTVKRNVVLNGNGGGIYMTSPIILQGNGRSVWAQNSADQGVGGGLYASGCEARLTVFVTHAMKVGLPARP